jgi:hypothetical protein
MATYNYNKPKLEEKQNDDVENSNLETEEQADVEAEASLVENLKNNFKRKK